MIDKITPEILVILFYGIGDLWTTKTGINMKMGEYNPLVRAILKKTGFAGFVISKSVMILAIFIYFPALIWGIAACGILITTLNIWQIVKYQKKYLMSMGQLVK